jgi:hypothetical protein
MVKELGDAIADGGEKRHVGPAYSVEYHGQLGSRRRRVYTPPCHSPLSADNYPHGRME